MSMVEIGHFYLNEESYDVSYLQDIKQYLPVDSTKVLFIDDYSYPEKNLNIDHLKASCEFALKEKVEIAYESRMVEDFDDVYALLNPKNIIRNRYRKQGTEKLDLIIDGEIFSLATVKPYFKPTCLMLSLCWSLHRLKYGSTITIIDEKYYSIEEKVLKLISYIDDGQGSKHRENIHLLII